MRTNYMRGVLVFVAFGLVACSAADEPTVDVEKSTLVATPEGVHAEDDCQTVRVWLDTHRDALPASYDEVIGFPLQYRRAIVASHSPNVRSALWRAHIERYVQQHPPPSVLGALGADTSMVSPEPRLGVLPSPEAFSVAMVFLETIL